MEGWEKRLEIIKSCSEEIIGEDELITRLKKNKTLRAYDGFEPSGNIHIAQGLLRTITINKLITADIEFIMLIGDWFAMMNNKMGGDLEKIKTLGQYYIEVWKACGMNTEKVSFKWASEIMNSEYWLTVLRIGTHNSVERITRCAQIMGRSEKEKLSGAQIFYPCMQATDIFHLNVDIAQLGMDQRKVNMLARETAPHIGQEKPIAVHHHMLMGLVEPSTHATGAESAIAKKMSKSNPNSAIFMTDSVDEVTKKFKKAYCPEKQVENNPVLEYCKYIIFEKIDTFTIERPEKFGGTVSYTSYADLEQAFISGNVHPADLKNATAKYINELLQPIRDHFANNEHAKALLEQIRRFEVTR